MVHQAGPPNILHSSRFLSEGAHNPSKSSASLTSSYGGEMGPCGAELCINPMDGCYLSRSWTQVVVTLFSSMGTSEFFELLETPSVLQDTQLERT